MLDTPRITQTTPRITASIHMTIPRAEMPKVFGPGVGELMAAIAAQGIEPAGSVFTHHLKMAPDIFDFELSVSVSRPVVAAGRVKPTEWPARVHGMDQGRGTHARAGPLGVLHHTSRLEPRSDHVAHRAQPAAD